VSYGRLVRWSELYLGRQNLAQSSPHNFPTTETRMQPELDKWSQAAAVAVTEGPAFNESATRHFSTCIFYFVFLNYFFHKYTLKPFSYLKLRLGMYYVYYRALAFHWRCLCTCVPMHDRLGVNDDT
jgi:hypothetical protein